MSSSDVQCSLSGLVLQVDALPELQERLGKDVTVFLRCQMQRSVPSGVGPDFSSSVEERIKVFFALEPGCHVERCLVRRGRGIGIGTAGQQGGDHLGVQFQRAPGGRVM